MNSTQKSQDDTQLQDQNSQISQPVGDQQRQNHTSVQHLIDEHHTHKQQPSQPVSFPKESGPPGMTIEAPSMPENAKDNAEQHEVAHFVEEVNEQQIKLSADLKKAGLKSTGDATTPTGFQNIQLPISDEKILNGQKAPITSSMRWLSEFCLYMLKQAHISLKEVHGHVVRVIKRN